MYHFNTQNLVINFGLELMEYMSFSGSLYQKFWLQSVYFLHRFASYDIHSPAYTSYVFAIILSYHARNQLKILSLMLFTQSLI